jgi:quercetin dioxygenase-like cupin family protein
MGNLATVIELRCPPHASSLAHTCTIEDRAIYVIAGELTAHTPLGGHTLRAGQLIWEPRGLRRGYTVGAEDAHLLLIHVPGTDLPAFYEHGGLAHLAEGNGQEVEQFAEWASRYSVRVLEPVAHPPTRPITTLACANTVETGPAAFAEPLDYTLTNQVTVSRGDDRIDSGQSDSTAGPTWTFHLGGHQTGAVMGAMEFTWEPNDVRPFHTHTLEDRSIFVVDGSVDIVLADLEVDGSATVALDRHQMMWIPRGTKHTYRVGPHGARVLMTYFPGTRVDQMYRRTATGGNIAADPATARAWLAWTARDFGVIFDLSTPVPG